ncbi:MAG: 1-deoxy-D-xylulose-5-phosphate reductoisomerase [Huintestinicola sp.]
MKTINLLGSTGSIGEQTVKVCKKNNIKIHSAAVLKNYRRLAEQAREFHMKRVCIYDESRYNDLKRELSDTDTEILCGMEGLCELAGDTSADLTLNSVVGMVGLLPTLAALEKGMDVALANKETLVAGGKLVMEAAKKNNAAIYPVDSEHSAIFQCLMALRGTESERNRQLSGIILTASGGPFYGKKRSDLEQVTVEQALAHPNWSMGRKISVDSATLMNKGLEFIEAKWLFGVSPEQIEIVVHRQSIVHSAVVLADNAVIAQLGVPDMAVPIQYALTYPMRCESPSKRLSLTDLGSLTFEKPDFETFGCLSAAVRSCEMGGCASCIVNSANEEAVSMFLDGKISFLKVGELVAAALENVKNSEITSCEDILSADKAAREFVRTYA